MKINQILFILFFISLYSFDDTLKEDYEEHCDGVDFTKLKDIKMNNNEFEEQRKDRDNRFYSKYVRVVDWLKHEGNDDIEDVTLAYFTIVIIGAGLAGLSVFLLLCFLFGLSKKYGKNAKCFSVLTCLLFLLFIAALIIALIFLFKSADKKEQALCLYHKFANSATNGDLKTENEEFIGFRNYQKIINNFSEDMDSIPSKIILMNDILNDGITTNSRSAQDRLNSWVVDAKPKKTSNSIGENKTPHSVLNINQQINDDIGKDFNRINVSTRKLERSLEEGLKLNDNSYFSNVKAISAAVVGGLG